MLSSVSEGFVVADAGDSEGDSASASTLAVSVLSVEGYRVFFKEVLHKREEKCKKN